MIHYVRVSLPDETRWFFINVAYRIDNLRSRQLTRLINNYLETRAYL